MFGIPARSFRSALVASDVRGACVAHHGGIEQCLILRHLHAGAATYYAWNIGAAHIYNKEKCNQAAVLDFGVDDPQNILVLMRHLEYEFDKGRLMFIPAPEDAAMKQRKRRFRDTLEPSAKWPLEIHVHNELRSEDVWTCHLSPHSEKWYDKVQVLRADGHYSPLTFGELDGKIFEAAPVYMRRLFEKAVGAWLPHKGNMPNPHDSKYLERFRSGCLSWEKYARIRWRQVGSASVEQRVEHPDPPA